ncbi:MAG: class D sortase [Anaeromicrobium sp.]|jgi:sortase A|uniref:class D sortase n=1 Tax=Anaeromicrobium sp. TaxID=1929132 RepID=UPI0025EDB323|nr:class D sortase [Anaeromicrobium sp.]MCT4596222.1 class D sortase [Anaeromicrobium sp.]
MKKKISTLIIIIGLIIILYPKVEETYNNYEQEKLIKYWEENMSSIDSDVNALEEDKENLLGENDTIIHDKTLNNEIDLEISNEKEIREEKKRKEEERNLRQVYIDEHMEGMLKIDKINLYLPILTDATKENLKISVSSIKNTGKTGQIGNYAIAGHRSKTYGRNFNRLDELTEGDYIKVFHKSKEYVYIVTEKLLVKPNEVWVLSGNGNDKEITLITCDPMINPTHRLIIKGMIIKEE